jgi:hypothetical protein
MTSSEIPPVPPRQLDQKYWLIFGAVFSAFIFGVFLYAFLLPEVSCDQWTLLRFVMPIFVGIAAGAFVGGISANGSVNQLAIAATGGFAVWLISLLVIGPPSRCNIVRISNFVPIENANATGTAGKKYPSSPIRKEGSYDMSDPSEFVLFVGFAVSNFSIEGGDKVELTVRVEGLNDKREVVWAEPETIDSLRSWQDQDLVKKLTVPAVEKALGISDSRGKYIVLWAIECFNAKQLTDWSGEIRITATDNGQRAGEVTKVLSIAKRPSEGSVTTLKCAACAESGRNM